ncbi:MAG: succinylglutamate desuccinylase/aspartoacylase family protein [Woeseiaceae bacterium]
MIIERVSAILLSIVLVIASVNVAASEAFRIGPYAVANGERLDASLVVAAGDSDPETTIPITVLAGTSDGPTVLLIAGVHGFEFTPILAVERLADHISPDELAGTIVIVRVAHLSAFEHRSPYVNPYDRKNLNRSFPGAVDGTQTERIAHTLSTMIIPTADFVFDVHSGDGAEWLEAFVGVYGGPLASDYEAALGVAEAMAFPNIVRYSMNTQAQVDTRRSLNRQAVAQGLPTVLVEIGENGGRDPKNVALLSDALLRALSYLKSLPASEQPDLSASRYFDGTQSVVVEHSGIWNPRYRVGRDVEAGEILGEIKDYTGKVVEVVTAPISGHTIYGLAGPPIRKGDSVASIAKPVATLR